MQESLAQTTDFAATLQLQDAIQVSGDLSALKDGRLQLGPIRILQGPASGGELKLRAGMVATLSLDNADSYPQPPDISPVTLTRVSGDRLTLEFADSNSATARRYRELVADAKPAPRSEEQSVVLTGATAEYSDLLIALHEHSLAELDKMLQRFLGDLNGYLLELSSRIKHAESGENPHYEAAVKVRGKGKKIIRDMLNQVDGYYRDLTPAQGDDQLWQYNIEGSEGLDLIDIKDFEDYLAIDRMITLGEDLYRVTLEALVIRFGVLIDADPNQVRLPIHVRQLCRAFQFALKQQKMPQEVLSHIFDYFAKHFIRKLADYYEPINEGLARRGVDPQVENEIKHKGTLLKEKKQPRPRRSPRCRRGKPRRCRMPTAGSVSRCWRQSASSAPKSFTARWSRP
jgi:hypothetical protein